MLSRYEPSGRVSPLFFIVVPFGAAAVVAMAAAYEWLLIFLPVKFMVVLLGVVGGICAAAGATYWTVRLGRARSLGAASLLGLGLGGLFVVATFVAAWAMHPQGRAAGVGAGQFFDEVRQQGVQVFGRRAGTPSGPTPASPAGQTGGQSAAPTSGAGGGLRIKGWMLTTLWVFEGLVLVGAGFGGGGIAATRPFCETCGRWALKSRWKFECKGVSEGSVTVVKGAQHFGGLLEVSGEPARGQGKQTLEYTIRACPCGEVATLFVRLHTSKSGSKEKSTTDVQEGVLLGPNELTRLFEWAERRDPSMAARRPALQVKAVEARPAAQLAKLPPLPSPPAAGQEPPVSTRSFRSHGTGDLYVEIPYTKALRERLWHGDFASAQQALEAQTDLLALACVAEACADWDGKPPPWFDAWEAARPDSGWAPLIRGIHGVKWAWQARGGGFNVKQEKGLLFQERLEEAEAHLLGATEMLPRDPNAWTWLIYASMGLQLSTDESMRRFKKAIGRSPQHRPAYSFMLQRLCEKWGGSHEKMFTLARRGSAAAPAGSTVHVVIAEAHMERWAAHQREGGAEAAREYATRADVRQELLEANARCFRPGVHRPGVDTPRARAWFAYMLWKAGAKEAAAEHLRIMGTSTPWGIFAPHLPGVRKDSLRTARRECGV